MDPDFDITLYAAGGAIRMDTARSTMEGAAGANGVSRFLDRTLAPLEQATGLLLLLLTLVRPATGRAGIATWALVLGFTTYNLLADGVRRSLRDASYTWKHLIDVPVAGFVYWLGGEPGGPLSVFFFLAVVCTAASESLRFTVLYTTAVGVVTAALDPRLPGWSGSMSDIGGLGARLVLLALLAASTAILTRRASLEREVAISIREKADQLVELNTLRKEFVSAVSHDLRTPLTAARASLGLLETSAADRLHPEERGLLENGRRNMERLGMLIDDLLTINQIEAGTLHLEHTVVDLRGIVGRAIGVVHPLIREKAQVLAIDIPAPLPVIGDARRLEHVLVNVLANAHEHTPEGTMISISARTAPRQTVLSIADDGPGIPAGELDAIFQRFHSAVPAHGGSGLGLAIARSIVEMHGGRIWAESSRGTGATFHIALPRAEEVWRSGC